MGLPVPERQSPGPRPIVAFDFDGTLTTRDSFTLFVAWRAGPIRYGLGLLRLAPEIVLYPILRDRGRLKASAIREFLSDLTVPQLADAAEAFAQAWSERLLRPDALAAWSQWRDKGAVMTIVTASPEVLIAPFARRLGADHLIGTKLAADKNDRITGAIDGENCRGPEKVRRLMGQFGTDSVLAAAYGDTSGDREMLAMAAERGYRVFKGKP
jgi:phosphatidylglycerophosphatase C